MPFDSLYSQGARQIGLRTPLGEDVLLLRSMVARERVSGLFDFELELLSADEQVSSADLLGQAATVRLEMASGSPRYFNGLISRFAHVGFDGRLSRYQATLVPWLWLLTRTSDCRIFQEMTAPEIVKQVFREEGFSDFEDRLSDSYRTWEYCVQYRETHYNFVSRLMEHEGIYWYFTHQQGKHTLILADDYSSHQGVPGYEQIPYHAADLAAERDQDFIHSWSACASVRSGVFVHDAFDFKKPRVELRASCAIARQHARADYEVFDYPGGYVMNGEGDRYAEVRMQELQADQEIFRGEGYARGLSVGHLFRLTQYPRGDQNREYLVLSAQHRLRADGYQSQDGAPTERLYEAKLTAIDAHTPYRPPRVTPKPVVEGPQTAIVVGPAGEEIWTDEYGRIKVQFHWDRYGQMDENSSCWIRVSHSWAGGTWGAFQIPRIGQEVIVSFLEGDPDRPMVTGCVYNAANMPAYNLPATKTRSSLRSQTHKGSGHNEIAFEDEAGREDLFVHAQKDHTLKVLNNQSANVLANRVEAIGENATIKIGRNHVERVDANKSVTVGGGGGRLLGLLGPLVAAGGRLLEKGAGKVDAPKTLCGFAEGVSMVEGLPKEAATLSMKSDFVASGQHREGAGGAQTSATAMISALVGAIMPSTGALSTIVERFRQDTVGLAATEQIGVAKNTVVGAAMTTSVGRLMHTLVGGDYSLEAKKSIFSRTVRHTLHAKEKFIIGGPGATIIIDESGMTIKARRLQIKSPSVDFMSGAPDQVDALKGEAPFVQECETAKEAEDDQAGQGGSTA